MDIDYLYKDDKSCLNLPQPRSRCVAAALTPVAWSTLYTHTRLPFAHATVNYSAVRLSLRTIYIYRACVSNRLNGAKHYPYRSMRPILDA